MEREDSSLPCGDSWVGPIHVSRSQEPLVADGLHHSETVTLHPEVMSEGSDKLQACDTLNANDQGGPCGWFGIHPLCLQRFRTPRWVLFWICWAGALQGLIVNGFVNVVITTIERRFNLKSRESGLIAGCYDIASFLCLIPVSYLGGTRNKPHIIGGGVLVLALGSFVFSLPHFLSDTYTFSKEAQDVCNLNYNWTNCNNNVSYGLSYYKYVFFLGQLLHGAGASPFYTLGCTYLDENVSTKMSSVYLGIYYTMAIIGPALGYILGGQFLEIYTDIGVDPAEHGLTSASSVWVGAWWLGFLFAAGVGFLVAIPIGAFPKLLPGYYTIQSRKVSEMHGKLKDSEVSQSGFGNSIADLPASLKILLINPTFVFLSLAGASEGMILSGLATFLPKVIESQFSVAASAAALLVGMVTVPGAGGGTFFGGYLVKKFNLRCASIIRMCLLFSVICLTMCTVFFIHCPNPRFAGVDTPVTNTTPFKRDVVSFKADCNAQCDCPTERYNPVCGTDNVIYFSPCFAGCQSFHHLADTKVYENCTCVEGPGRNETIKDSTVVIQAVREKCPNSCTLMPLFLVMIFFAMLFTFLVSMPSLSATLRCVAESQKSFALGIQWITVRLLGTIPGPVLFGSLIDLSCDVWQEDCSGQGACLVYDNKRMNIHLLIITCVLKILSALFFFLAWFLYRPPQDVLDSNPQEMREITPEKSLPTVTQILQTPEINGVNAPNSDVISNGVASHL
ncbi:solute carrier organic anion transporter family member 4A1-like [Limulus polyphemus]|uniref:Solute carrier organic anion transporter family member n=1 Tax=Limulus polyphemus TaxID=6850 RepID=A0ABM1SG42_LIMPO|nr:solute carrier organic anion transporter family member 4A1-like [Limulus polyphemus]XP_022242597.1 solute carrier organic anion transporter family member 4A1-like [Limulus polyphemus]XP_022242601.1 solute carrier organic anion transporter family member 4A1-like [Limulus polyphemus]